MHSENVEDFEHQCPRRWWHSVEGYLALLPQYPSGSMIMESLGLVRYFKGLSLRQVCYLLWALALASRCSWTSLLSNVHRFIPLCWFLKQLCCCIVACSDWQASLCYINRETSQNPWLTTSGSKKLYSYGFGASRLLCGHNGMTKN